MRSIPSAGSPFHEITCGLLSKRFSARLYHQWNVRPMSMHLKRPAIVWCQTECRRILKLVFKNPPNKDERFLFLFNWKNRLKNSWESQKFQKRILKWFSLKNHKESTWTQRKPRESYPANVEESFSAEEHQKNRWEFPSIFKESFATEQEMRTSLSKRSPIHGKESGNDLKASQKRITWPTLRAFQSVLAIRYSTFCLFVNSIILFYIGIWNSLFKRLMSSSTKTHRNT